MLIASTRAVQNQCPVAYPFPRERPGCGLSWTQSASFSGHITLLLPRPAARVVFSDKAVYPSFSFGDTSSLLLLEERGKASGSTWHCSVTFLLRLCGYMEFLTCALDLRFAARGPARDRAPSLAVSRLEDGEWFHFSCECREQLVE